LVRKRSPVRIRSWARLARGSAEEETMRDLISLVCDECRSKNYSTTKNKKRTTDKLAFKKFCPRCRSHTLHKEGKV
jgi:large subunit ribosomal protein L33